MGGLLDTKVMADQAAPTDFAGSTGWGIPVLNRGSTAIPSSWSRPAPKSKSKTMSKRTGTGAENTIGRATSSSHASKTDERGVGKIRISKRDAKKSRVFKEGVAKAIRSKLRERLESGKIKGKEDFKKIMRELVQTIREKEIKKQGTQYP